MAFDLDDIVLVKVAPLGAPGTGVTAGDWTSYKATVDALNARANITKLDDVPDVNAPAPADGNALVYQASSHTWIPAANLEALAAVKVNGATVLANAQKLNFSSAFTGAVNGTDGTQTDVGANVGTTSGTLAAGDHVHNAMIPNRWTFAATGSLSSGTRTVSTQTSSVLLTSVTYDWTAELNLVGTNDVNSGHITLTVTVNGSSQSRTRRTNGGVDLEHSVPYSGTGLVGAGAGIMVSGSVTYVDGDSTTIGDGYLLFHARPRR